MSNGSISGEWIEDDVYAIAIEGDFDGSMRDTGIAATETALDLGPAAVLVDVKRCTFLDSTAIAVLIGARRRSLDAGVEFALVGHNPTVDRMIELTGLAEELVIMRDRKEALATLR